MKVQKLKRKIVDSLTKQGFYVNGHVMPAIKDKAHYRMIQNCARQETIQNNQKFILENAELVKGYFPTRPINPQDIRLELREVIEGSIEQVIYRWWNLVWWSVPFQRAYGRQMRYILWDTFHDAPFGIVGLQSPVLKMSVRDDHLQIPKENLDVIINQSMQAQRLGALPPYNSILGGKLVAMALTSNELRNGYKAKYKGATTLIMEREIENELLFITTTSAFGRSSIYNRLKYYDEPVAKSLGYTKGSGTFHVTNEIYKDLQAFLQKNEIDTNTTFGYGASRKMKLIDQAFSLLNLKEYHYHNIQREFFLFPLAKNLQNVIQKGKRPVYFQRTLNEIVDFWKIRWALKRADANPDWQSANFDQMFSEFKSQFDLK